MGKWNEFNRTDKIIHHEIVFITFICILCALIINISFLLDFKLQHWTFREPYLCISNSVLINKRSMRIRASLGPCSKNNLLLSDCVSLPYYRHLIEMFK